MRTETMKRSILVGVVAGMLSSVTAATAAEPDWKAVEHVLGRSGQLQAGGVFRVGMARTDLAVTVKGVPVKAGFALGSYAAFKQMGDQAMSWGSRALDQEVPAVMSGPSVATGGDRGPQPSERDVTARDVHAYEGTATPSSSRGPAPGVVGEWDAFGGRTHRPRLVRLGWTRTRSRTLGRTGRDMGTACSRCGAARPRPSRRIACPFCPPWES